MNLKKYIKDAKEEFLLIYFIGQSLENPSEKININIIKYNRKRCNPMKMNILKRGWGIRPQRSIKTYYILLT